MRLAQEHRGEYSYLWASIESIAGKIGCAAPTLHEWVKRREVDAGLRDGVSSEARQRIEALERENKELRRANEILKLASAFLAQAELDRRLQSWRRSSTGTGTPTGSSRSAKSCGSPRLAIGAMPPSSVPPPRAVPRLSGTRA